MPMPEATVDEDRDFVFREHDINGYGARRAFHFFRFQAFCEFLRNRDADVEAEAVAHSMQQRAHDAFRRCVLSPDTAHVP